MYPFLTTQKLLISRSSRSRSSRSSRSYALHRNGFAEALPPWTIGSSSAYKHSHAMHRNEIISPRRELGMCLTY